MKHAFRSLVLALTLCLGCEDPQAPTDRDLEFFWPVEESLTVPVDGFDLEARLVRRYDRLYFSLVTEHTGPELLVLRSSEVSLHLPCGDVLPAEMEPGENGENLLWSNGREAWFRAEWALPLRPGAEMGDRSECWAPTLEIHVGFEIHLLPSSGHPGLLHDHPPIQFRVGRLLDLVDLGE